MWASKAAVTESHALAVGGRILHDCVCVCVAATMALHCPSICNMGRRFSERKGSQGGRGIHHAICCVIEVQYSYSTKGGLVLWGGIMAHGTLLIKVETVESVGLTFSFEGRTRVLLLPVLSSTCL